MVLELESVFSNDLIRRGDSFNILLNIRNLYNDAIIVNGYEINFPQGFKVSTKPGAKLRFTKDTEEFFSDFIPFKELKTTDHKREHVEIPNGVKRPISIPLRAGRILGFKPRPDLYKISITIFYTHDNTLLNRSIEIDLRIYASLQGMLGGTILGSVLGNFAVSEFRYGIDTPISILSSIVFGFVAGIILMRRKDIQAFITIEDFWGGILVGFTIGLLGKEVVINLLTSNPVMTIDPSNSTLSNMTG